MLSALHDNKQLNVWPEKSQQNYIKKSGRNHFKNVGILSSAEFETRGKGDNCCFKQL